ncbi:MAG: 3-phosphoserine/phosphohydroxythreonine transaminase [Deltaproteobacteria bacterium]|nr:3-phosphoserine/phosphohydroxythreonine transaminase [Deltaproteobacteria bacterium]MBW2025412.1 3-phosphoserine/phosphohydroxythreonine transaminase [Deltaproteobacteria bacterium]MBW2125922.1 3-phosphoserine/phosphohydroxythreonine transaminase [Deltaproteobacteria bacterium]RLB14042.1 MAG: 3-phosphoserine/phosphohydroxythreonine transaminase [Deltaproteobacteria bacterium]
MEASRIHNFNPGPAALPLPVLEEIRNEFLNYKGCGMSVTEISHRSKWFDEIINGAVERTKRLLHMGDDFHVLFIQGGASLQFCMIPMNLSLPGRPVDYINTGTWSTKAIKEAQIQGKDVRVIASSEDANFSYIPKDYSVDPDAAYLHFTSNNTIKGTQWSTFPDAGDVPLISDMSSDIMSRPFDVRPFGLIYAGAQKNIGPAGAALVIVRKDMLERVPGDIPTMLKYTTFAEKNSLFNTPPCFVIYVISLVLRWLEETIGGLEKMEQINKQKAALLYDLIDQSDFYRGTAAPDSRSLMNVTFRLPSEDLEARFVEEALKEGLGGLKGHRSVGGCRASIYNAVSLEAVTALRDFMVEFERKNG